ncbi:putative BRCA1-associated RING domain protein 1 [Sesbania bispinosa]|nr:putative BRCA1-associated RING domain protein 1 [Sesbania bispinosa]
MTHIVPHRHKPSLTTTNTICHRNPHHVVIASPPRCLAVVAVEPFPRRNRWYCRAALCRKSIRVIELYLLLSPVSVSSLWRRSSTP